MLTQCYLPSEASEHDHLKPSQASKIYLPKRNGRLSWLFTYQDGLLSRRWLPIQVLTVPDVEQLHPNIFVNTGAVDSLCCSVNIIWYHAVSCSYSEWLTAAVCGSGWLTTGVCGEWLTAGVCGSVWLTAAVWCCRSGGGWSSLYELSPVWWLSACRHQSSHMWVTLFSWNISLLSRVRTCHKMAPLNSTIKLPVCHRKMVPFLPKQFYCSI